MRRRNDAQARLDFADSPRWIYVSTQTPHMRLKRPWRHAYCDRQTAWGRVSCFLGHRQARWFSDRPGKLGHYLD